MNAEELELLSDSKYRQFINAVEKALRSFEYSSEWADLISALGKLNKVLQNHTKFKVLPRKLTIGKRLAQCMHPTLPSGVHLKALETYELIFKRIGHKGLAQDLFIYSAGLFPLLGNAAMSTRPVLMTMYENYFLPLGKALLPGLSGLLLGLLPGIEEGSEYTDRTISLLGSFSENTDKNIFYTTLWECIYSSASIRLPAITFILTRLNKKGAGKQKYLLGNDIPLLVQAVSVALRDSNILVQRNMLDFLLVFVPVDTSYLSPNEKVTLVAAALEVLLRRDMSLNRRLYTWLLGTNSAKNESLSRTDSVCSSDAEGPMETFFSLNSRPLVVEAVRKVFQNQCAVDKGDSNGSKKAQRLEVLKPFRLLISLLDKPEIGGSILEDVLLDVFRALYNQCKVLKENSAAFEESDRRDSIESTILDSGAASAESAKTKLIDELIKTANLLFNAFEPYFMWEYIAKLLAECDKPPSATGEGVNGVEREDSRGLVIKPSTTTCSEVFRLTDFILDVVTLEADVEIQTEHWPELLRRITIEMTKRCETMTLEDVKEGICLCSRLLSKVMPSMKTTDKGRSDSGWFAENKDRKKELEGSSEHELHEWNIIDIKGTVQEHKNVDRRKDKSLESSQEVFVEETGESEATDEEESTKVESVVALNEKELDLITQKRDGGTDSANNYEDTQDELDEWSDFQEAESSSELNTLNPASSEKDSSRREKTLVRSGEDMLSKDSKHLFQPSLIQACVNYFQNFFAKFVVERVLKHVNSLCLSDVSARGILNKECYTALRASGVVSDAMWKQMEDVSSALRDEHFENACKTQTTLKARRNVVGPTALVSSFRSMQSSKNCAEAFAAACKLLLELSCFPVWGGKDSESQKTTTDKDEVSKVSNLPEWLQSLIMCCFEVSEFDIQSSAVGTLLDLINLTLSVSAGHAQGPRPSAPVVVIPMISQQSLGVIEKSDLYEVIAESLWDHLKEDTTQFHNRIVQLFLQLHNLTPSPSLCANVIGNSLVDISKEVSLQGHWKFAVFWHVARNVVIQDSGRSSRLGEFRTLDRALFIMLDSLQNDEPEIRVLTQHWLAHALQHGDLGRIIDPLLLLLLHPITARVSIHYLYSLFDTKIAMKMSNAREAEKKTSNDVKAYPTKEIETAKQNNERVKRKSSVTSAKTRESDDSKTTSPSGPSEAEHSTDTDGDGAEADDENEENEPKKGKEKDDLPNKAPQSPPQRRSLVHPLDQHKLLYILHYDSQLTLYAFSTLQTILTRAPHQFVCASSTTSISSSNTPHQEKIKELLIRHRRSLLGKGFYGALYESPVSPTGPAHSARLFGGPLIYLKPSTSKYLEVLISVSLYFIRSEYSSHLQVQPEDIDGNVQVQMASTELLLGVMWQLEEVVKESGAGFGTYISDMFSRCKVQKALLHCLLSTLYERTGVRTTSKSPSPTLKSSHIHVSSEISQSQARAFQVKLVKLVQSVFILESNIQSAVAISQENAASHGTPPPSKPESPAKISGDTKATQSAHRYIPGKPLAEQGMLMSAVLHGLRHDEPDMHYEWLQFVITCLSHMGMHLRTWVVPVAEHLCRILDRLTTVYIKDKDARSTRKGISDEFGKRRNEADVLNVPPDYMVSLLESLASICHYCLRDNTAPQSPALSLKPRIARSNSSPAVGVNSDLIQSSGSSVFTNLLHAFSVQSAPVSDVPSVEVPKHILDAREGLLSVLPKILSALFTIWSTWSPQRTDLTGQRLPSECPLNLMGSPKAVQQQILQLLTPITMNHTIVFLASLADVWYQRRRREGSGVKAARAIPVTSEEQIIVVDIVYAIKALSVEDMIDNVKQILRQVVTSKDKTTPTQSGLEVNILQFLYEYLHKASESQLIVVRSSLLSLMKEGLQLNFPPALFLLLVILRSYVQNIPLQEDKKVRKELQDITQRLVEACNTVAGSSLENAAWFRRTLAVIPQPEVGSDQSSNVESEISETEPPVPPPTVPSGNTSNTSSYSTQALCVLAEVLAPVLDMVFGSDEKERMTSFLTTVMYNVTPFLKNHSPHNVPSFRACCNLLASLSGYQYTRRAWKKEVMELLLDPNFFQMDITCIGSWQTIIDNLMTQDNTSFKELMTRVAGLSQSASINIFANREQEMEQRAQLLKKLSFTIFCSEVDQYQYALPEIQERLAESLRLPQSPVVHEQIFLFFRVLILRMSAQHLTPLWPTIVSEVVHVLLQMESDLSADGKSHKQRMVISELLLGSNGYVNYSQEKWLGLYLAVCKLLDLSQALPSEYLSQFQLYRWAFEGEAYNMTAGEEKVPVFKPHIARLEKLLRKKRRDQGDVEELQRVSGQPLLTMYQIKSLDQLLPFFQCLSRNRFENCGESRDKNNKSKNPQGKSMLERVVERDFLEPLVVD